jgi:hypothetical protein
VENIVKVQRELVRTIDQIEKLKEKYPKEVQLICDCEFPSYLKAFLSTTEDLSKTMQPFRLPWFLIDKDGWQIETVRGRRLKSFLRILVQNIRKIVG